MISFLFILSLTYLGYLFCASQADNVLSKIVTTKYGKIQGIIRHHSRPNLPPVEVYLGIPYASPPIGDGRFTPTSSPLPWDSVKKCDELPPVCPQPLWEDESNMEPGSVPEDIEEYYRSMTPLLKNQNEDCLYLNIYTPHDGGGKYPVMVYIHGGSFSWGSGNLYDGGALSSYGQIVVVTVNYRLGPLGFLNTSPGRGRSGVVSNQGLMDQLAALSWVQENIESFGGDPESVTLVGHSTGAACVGYLLASPVLVPGLFHRAVLMSGSALSPWAQVSDALSVTIRLAKLLNCSVPRDLSRKHPETIGCLRNVTFRQLVDAPMPKYKFASVYGPSVDGVVVQENFQERLIRTMKERKITLMFGVTELDAYPELTAAQIKRGLSMSERNRVFRTFVRNTYQHHLQEIYLAIAKEYTDWENPTQHPFQIRDWTLEALSDAAYLSPLLKFADMSVKSESFMYVFSHREHERHSLGSVFRSEIPLLFGSPFQDNQLLPQSSSDSSSSSYTSSSSYRSSSIPSSSSYLKSLSNFSKADALVSEYLMRYWTNFVKSGHPDLPEEPRPLLSFRERINYKNVSWEPYDQIFEKYLEISSRPRLRDHFRAHKVALWNWLLPELEDAGSKYPEAESEVWHTSEDGKYFIGPVRPLDPFRFLQPTLFPPTSKPSSSNTFVNGYLAPNVSAAQGSLDRELNNSKLSNLEKVGSLLDYTTALTLTVAIGLSLLVLNVILFAALLYKRDRTNMVSKMKYDSVSAQPLCTVDSGLRTTSRHETITPPGKEVQSTCSADPQCTELHTFPSPPDIVDRNTEVTFLNNSAIHSILSQPTSQFIPPPPLLSTTSPTPNANIGSDDLDESSCVQPRHFPDVGTDSVPDAIAHYSIDSPTQYKDRMGENKNYSGGIASTVYHSEDNTGRCQIDNFSTSKGCLEGSSCSSSFPSAGTQCTSVQYCPSQYSTSATQYSKSKDKYTCSSSQFIASSCHLGVSNDQNTSRYYTDSSYQESCKHSPDQSQGSRGSSSRSSTLTRQSSGSGGNSSSRKPQPPQRTITVMPSYATLPRKDIKE